MILFCKSKNVSTEKNFTVVVDCIIEVLYLLNEIIKLIKLS